MDNASVQKATVSTKEVVQPAHIKIVDIDIPFSQMVMFLVTWFYAGIVASFFTIPILLVVYFLLKQVLFL